MDEIREFKDWIFAGVIAVLGFMGKWWFTMIDHKVVNLQERINEAEKNIELNTQSDMEYRERVTEKLEEIKQDQKETKELIIELLKK